MAVVNRKDLDEFTGYGFGLAIEYAKLADAAGKDIVLYLQKIQTELFKENN